jgi:hypothetical protein
VIEGIGDCRREELAARAQRNVHSSHPHPCGIVQRAAEWIEQPRPTTLDASTPAAFLAEDRILRPLLPQQGKHRILGLDVGIGGEVAPSLIEPFESRSEAAADYSSTCVSYGDGNINVVHT